MTINKVKSIFPDKYHDALWRIYGTVNRKLKMNITISNWQKTELESDPRRIYSVDNSNEFISTEK